LRAIEFTAFPRETMPRESVLTTMPLLAQTAGLGWLLLAFAVAVLAMGSHLIWLARRLVVGTTLTAAWWWAALAWCALVAAAMSGVYSLDGADHAGWQPSLAMAVGMLSVCPGVAVLGAKRPQHVAWQWIVLSLWVVLVLPAVGWQLLDTEPSVHPARRWFLLVLVAMGVVNYLPTRYGLAAFLLGAAQWLLLADYLPGGGLLQGVSPRWALLVIVFALGALWRRVDRPANEDPLERLWRDFRDLYGLLWGLRVAERFNTQANAGGWTVTLSWRGFHTPSDSGVADLAPEERQAVVDNLSSWLRRFVDAGWIEKRLVGQSAPSV
jgi:hypothetical protein